MYVTDMEDWNGTDRHHFNAIVSPQDLVEVCSIYNSILCMEIGMSYT